MEHVLIALWRAPLVAVDTLHAGVVDEWAPIALADEHVEALTVSTADADQGIYARPPDARGLVANCDVLIRLGLARAHDLDDVPERDVLYELSRRVDVWRVDTRRPIEWDRTWRDGERAPGVKMVSFMRRAAGLTHEQFVRHWIEEHTPLAQRHHVGLWNYTQNVVRRAYTPGGEPIDGIAELHFATREDHDTRFFDSDDGRAVIMADVKRFMMPPGPETALMSELPLRTRRKPDFSTATGGDDARASGSRSDRSPVGSEVAVEALHLVHRRPSARRSSRRQCARSR